MIGAVFEDLTILGTDRRFVSGTLKTGSDVIGGSAEPRAIDRPFVTNFDL